MIAAEASATGDAAAFGPPRPGASTGPFERGDRFKGHYFCAQGRTELTLVFEETDEDALNVVFEFHFPGSTTHPAADGSYRMHGAYDAKSRQLRLKGEQWIDRPTDYVMVDLAGTVNASGAINGTLTGAPQCTAFSVTRDRVDSR
jgi:hypothetical protein